MAKIPVAVICLNCIPLFLRFCEPGYLGSQFLHLVEIDNYLGLVEIDNYFQKNTSSKTRFKTCQKNNT